MANKELVVVLDPGHGGDDPGAVKGSIAEKNLNLSITHLVRDLLKGLPIKVVLTREGDEHLTLTKRCVLANGAKADLFISIHFNAANGKASGHEVYYFPGSSLGLKAASILAEEFDQTQRRRYLGSDMQAAGVKGVYTVLQKTNAPAILGEYLFIDNPADFAKYDAMVIATAYANTIMRFFGIEKNNEPACNGLEEVIQDLEAALNKLRRLRTQG